MTSEGYRQSKRVLARFLEARGEIVKRDEGDFVLHSLPQHAKVVQPIIEKLHKAIKMCRAAGLPIQDKLNVGLDGRGISHADAAYYIGTQPPLVKVAPKAYNDAILVNTLIHELGHYVHDKVVPGGTGNQEIQSRYFWAMKQKATGEGPKLDVLRRQMKNLDAEIKALEQDRYDRKPLPKKGKEFEYQYRNTFTGKTYQLKARLLRKSGRFVMLEIIDPPKELQHMFGRSGAQFTHQETVDSLEFVGVRPGVDEKIKALHAEQHALYEQANEIARTEKDDRYESQRHAWAPTRYSRTNTHEWFAEICTTLVLGHLDKSVEEWLMSVLKTGKAPSGMTFS